MPATAPQPDRPLPLRYMPQLDALRALAVFAVWMEHWGNKQLAIFSWVDWGLLGVRLFFVLSGFLITGILLRVREGWEAQRHTTTAASGHWREAGHFYARRFLRILPIYYLTLFVVAGLASTHIVDMPGLLQLFKYHLTYTTNLYLVYAQKYPWNAGAHFWSLAVEEQFYLVWPWLILGLPRRWLAPAVWGAVGVGVGFRILWAVAGGNNLAGMLPVACLDQFALGGVLALVGQGRDAPANTRRFARVCLAAGLPLLLISAGLSARHRVGAFTFIAAGLGGAGTFTWLIAGAGRGFGGPAKYVLESRPLAFLGRVSYGLYIYHPFVAMGIRTATARLGHPLSEEWWVQFGVFALGTVAVATASWYLMEKPINRLKRFFQYSGDRREKPMVLISALPAGASDNAARVYEPLPAASPSSLH